MASTTVGLRATFEPLARRRCHTLGVLSTAVVDRWISDSKSLTLTDTFTPNHLADLHITLPTRDGTRGRPYHPPEVGTSLGYGHHLAFFHPRNPEAALRPDGTDPEFCPPEPFTRRMWAGGTMQWNTDPHSALRVGETARAVSSVVHVGKKGFNTTNPDASPMLVVTQRIEVTANGRTEPSVIEERSHVYLASRGGKRAIKKVQGLPEPDFSFTYKPSLTTLFRFSALTFNGHHIHLDRSYAQEHEGYPERLVHGPLTALMLLEVLLFNRPDLRLRAFAYRARNPIIVDRPCTIHGTFMGENAVELWCEDPERVVGMTGSVSFL
ncbi:hypothetical protein EDD16DRAFT_1535360 [Pisolithus croceorrhizus]|nr:hypothetical protein EV401DRAFT_2055040 [Pisolithus croceorrhizus]KAI6132217.1 hypothetical protein EDD16DRAFT_1535360 [Pisolithus croceorrhizus]